jgi:basic membrane protein A
MPALRRTLLHALLALPAALANGAVRAAGGRPAGPLRAALFVNGTLGDKSFYDSAARGMKAAAATLGIRTRVIEAGINPTRWEPALADLVEGEDFDVIITGSFTMAPLLQRLAPRYPQTRFMLFDATVNAAQCRCGNVHSILFRQNEGAYLAGYLAARLAPAQQPFVGVVGGMQIPVIDDFIVGFSAGAQAARPGIRVARQYVNSFTDPATAKEIARALFAQGASVLFHAAGGSGQGVIEAAAEAGRYVIGVDLDQYAMYRQSSPQRASRIVTSVLKNVDAALLHALRRHLDGSLVYGGSESLGLAEGAIALAPGSQALQQAGAALDADLQATRQRIVSGAVQVPSAFTVVRQ